MTLRSACCLVLALLPAVLRAQSSMPIPRTAYPGDHVFVPLIGGGDCNAARLDPARPPNIQLLRHFRNDSPHLDAYHYEVHYWLVEGDVPLCGTPPPPPTLLADVGELPPGIHMFEVSGRLGEQPHMSYSTGSSWVHRHPQFPEDVNGLWYDPAQSGRGVSVTRVAHDRLTLLWFTHDAQGLPDWVASTADKQGEEPRAQGLGFNTRGAPPGPGSAALTAQPWGTLEFDYLGCGRARLSWSPRDPGIAPASQVLQKLAQDHGAESCAPQGATRAIWTGR